MYIETETTPNPAGLKFLPGEQAMNPARVHAIISRYVCEGLRPRVLDDAELDDLEVDPFDRLGITSALDETFLIEILDDDVEAWETVGDVVETVQRLAAERRAACMGRRRREMKKLTINPIHKAHTAPRCLARTRSGTACQSPAVKGRKRCRMHGGTNPGAPEGNRNAWKHGGRSTKAMAAARYLREIARQMRDAE